MACKINNQYGEIVISDDVITNLAGLYAMECYGVVGMAAKRAKDGILELLQRENLSRGVKLTPVEDKVVIDLFVVLDYGVSMPAVCTSLIETVKFNLERTTGIRIHAVNVTVEEVRIS